MDGKKEGKVKHLNYAVFMLFMSLVCSTKVFAQVQEQKATLSVPKSRVWLLDFALLRYETFGVEDYSLGRTGGRFSIGYGNVEPKYFLLFSLDMYLGPYDVKYQTVQLDHTGTGFSVVAGRSLSRFPLRSSGLGLGFQVGLGYKEYTGKSYARNDFGGPIPPKTEKILIANNSQTSELDGNLGVFFSLMKAQRLDEHDPDSLVTRNEGLIFSLSGSWPLLSRFSSRYRYTDGLGVETEGGVKGSLEGFKVIVSMKTFLGT